jgi:ribosomal protein S18 acetylase RimI-like enzyme
MCEQELRRATTGDAEALCAFYNELSAQSKRTFRPLGVTTSIGECRGVVLANESGGKYDIVATRGGRIVGWGFLWHLRSEGPTLGLAVADAYQGQGIGSRLLDRTLLATRELGLARVHLTVVQDNVVAWKLYQSRGFVRCGEFVDSDGLPYYSMVIDVS